MSTIATLVLALAVPFVSAQSQFVGKWQGTTPSGSTVELTFAMAEEKLTATLLVNGESVAVSDIAVKENRLTFVGTRNERPQNMECELGTEELRCGPAGRPESVAVLKRAAEKK